MLTVAVRVSDGGVRGPDAGVRVTDRTVRDADVGGNRDAFCGSFVIVSPDPGELGWTP